MLGLNTAAAAHEAALGNLLATLADPAALAKRLAEFREARESAEAAIAAARD